MNDQQIGTPPSRPSVLSTGRVACPHCGRPGVSNRAKDRSSRGWPAKCSECGGLSYGAGVLAIIAAVLLEGGILPFGILFAFFLFGERRFMIALALTLGLCLVYRFVSYFADSARLWPVTPERSVLARRLTYAGVLVTIVCIIIYLVLKRHG